MRTRIWEDTAAMNIVSVLGFIMNDDGEVVGPERTQVLCKLMPSIHTATHRAILAMLVVGLSDADTQTFYAEKGLKVLNEWLLDGVRKPLSGTASMREKQRVELYSQVRALLRVLDANVQTDEKRKQNAFLNDTLVKLADFLDGSSAEFAAEWSRVNIYRRHFESACGIPTSVREARAEAKLNGSRGGDVKPAAKQPSSQASASSSSSASASGTAAATAVAAAPKISPLSVLNYQPKSFLQPKDPGAKDEEMDEFLADDDDELMLSDDGVLITNVSQVALSASLDAKIRNYGHSMQYGERAPCRVCRRMTAKRCERCNSCVKCAQKDTCNPSLGSSGSRPAGGPAAPMPTGGLSVSDRNVAVLGSAMDQAIYKAFKHEDFHSVFSLISNGMDVNFQRVESDFSSALMAAAHHGREDATDRLMSLGANPCLTDSSGVAAWMFAKRRGHVDLADKLKKAADEWKS